MSINPQQISGTFVFPNGTPAAGCTLKLQLSQSAVLSDGSGTVAPSQYNVVLDCNGSIPSSAEIYYNDDLLPTGTYYTWQVYASWGQIFPLPNGQAVGGQIVGTAPANLNTIPPVSNVVAPSPAPSVFGPLTVVQPEGSNLHVVVDSGGGDSDAADIATGASVGDTAPLTMAGTVADGGAASPFYTDDDGNLYVNIAESSVGVEVQYTNGSSETAPTGTLMLGFNGTTVQALPIDGSGNLSVSLHEVNQDFSGNLGVNIQNTPAVTATLAPSTTGGCNPYYYNGTGGSSAQTVKSTAGQIYSIQVFNTANTGTAFLNFYNSASPTVGSSTVKGFEVPAGLGAIFSLDQGVAFSTAITFSVATTASGNTALSSAVTVCVDYK